MRTFLTVAFAVLAPFAVCGCLPVVAGGATAGVREVTDKVVSYQGDIKSLEAAVLKTLKETGATIKETVREEGKAGKITFRARTFDGEHLTVDLEPTTPSTTQVEIRVGRIGSKSRAEEIHTVLKKYAKPLS